MKKLLTLLMALVMVLAFTACGGGGDGDGGDTETKAVKSTNGYISVMPYDKDDMQTFVDGSDEKISFGYPMERNKEYPEHKEFIEISTVGPDGDMWDASPELASFVAGEDYSEETLKSDFTAYCNEYSNIYWNLKEVKVGDYTYQKADSVKNAEDANVYFGVADNKPVKISVVGADLIDNADVNKVLKSIKLSFK